MATQWEYKVEGPVPEAGAFAQLLNDEGQEGWELVTAVDLGVDEVGRSMQNLVFRRDLANPTWGR